MYQCAVFGNALEGGVMYIIIRTPLVLERRTFTTSCFGEAHVHLINVVCLIPSSCTAGGKMTSNNEECKSLVAQRTALNMDQKFYLLSAVKP